MKAPEFVKINKWGHGSDLTETFNKGDTVCLSFGRRRSREIRYCVEYSTKNAVVLSRADR